MQEGDRTKGGGGKRRGREGEEQKGGKDGPQLLGSLRYLNNMSPNPHDNPMVRLTFSPSCR